MLSINLHKNAKRLGASLLLGLTAGVPLARGQEVFYYSDHARDLEVSAENETLLAFPAAPFARVCQPSGVVEFYPVQDAEDLQTMMLPRGIYSKDLNGRTGGESKGPVGEAEGNDMLARHLKLVVKKPQIGATSCAIRLVNEQVINVRIVPVKMLAKPIIEFRSIYEKTQAGAAVTSSLGSLNVFRALVVGGDLTFLADETPAQSENQPGRSRPYTQDTDTASYKLIYVGTDKENFRAWKFTGNANKAFRAQPLKDAKVGDFYFSSFRPVGGNGKIRTTDQKHLFASGEAFEFFVLSRPDINVSEMLGRLP